ncbi:hypothetical protein HPB50_023275 [Hyalomma asiaticum]|uniref:Uncharacterized protein n=1 Tax=Hyalomma asiaticum TaxID=266040 RepID=A0ACB7S5B3_HYAAI|nr:hypothetical protein HPB50_023275 [Hyalomma asiaticum]
MRAHFTERRPACRVYVYVFAASRISPIHAVFPAIHVTHRVKTSRSVLLGGIRPCNHADHAFDFPPQPSKKAQQRLLRSESCCGRMAGRKRFTLSNDIGMVKEVLNLNPFLDSAHWTTIAERLSELWRRTVTARTIKERINLILTRFLRDEKKKVKSSGTEEEESELLNLLQQLADLAHECGYNPPRSTLRSARRESTKSRGNGRRDDSRARARRPEVVDPREEAALAAFDASLTGNEEEGDLQAEGGAALCSGPSLAARHPPNTVATPVPSPAASPLASSPAGNPSARMSPPDIRTGEDRLETSARTPLQELPVDLRQQPLQGSIARVSPNAGNAAAARRSTPLRGRGALRQGEATVAILETRCEQEAAMESRRLRLEEDRLVFEMKRHNDNVRLREMELRQRKADLEAKTRLKELELQQRRIEQEALAEERRQNRSHQEAQLEIIKALLNK